MTQQATKERAVERARATGEMITEILVQYARNGLYGTPYFYIPMQAGMPQSARQGVERALPIERKAGE